MFNLKGNFKEDFFYLIREINGKCFFRPVQLLHSCYTNLNTQGVKPSSFPSVFRSMTSQSGPAVWTHSPIPVPPRCPPTFPFVYPPGMCNPSSSTSSTTDQEAQLHCCSLLFKNRLGYQLRDLDASWGLRNASTLPRSLISA